MTILSRLVRHVRYVVQYLVRYQVIDLQDLCAMCGTDPSRVRARACAPMRAPARTCAGDVCIPHMPHNRAITPIDAAQTATRHTAHGARAHARYSPSTFFEKMVVEE